MTELEVYYRGNYDRLVKRMYGRLGIQEDAEDVVQNAFVNALKYFHSFKPNSSGGLDSWFSAILTNACRLYMNKKRMGGLTKNIDECHNELEPIIPDHIGTLAFEEIKGLAFNKPGDYGRVLILNLQFGYTPKEISEITDIKVKSISNYLAQFTKEMKETYA